MSSAHNSATESTNLPSLGTAVFRRLRVLAVAIWLLAVAAPIAYWGVGVVSHAGKQAEAVRRQVRQALDANLDALANLAAAAAHVPLGHLKTRALGQHSAALELGGVAIRYYPVSASQPAATALPAHLTRAVLKEPGRGFALVEGKPVLFAAVPVFGSGTRPVSVVEAYQPVEQSLAGLQQPGFHTLVYPIGSARGPAASGRGGIVWCCGEPRAAASVLLTDNFGNPIARVVGMKQLGAGLLPAAVTSLIIGLVGALLIVLFGREASAMARGLSATWRQAARVLSAIAEGNLAVAAPSPHCRETAEAIQAIERLRSRLLEQERLLNNTSKLQSLLAHTYQEDKLAQAVWHYISLVGADVAEVIHVDSSRAHARPVFRGARRGMEPAERVVSVPEDCPAFRQAAPFRIDDTRTELVCETCVGPRDRSYYCVPLLGRGTAIGILRLASRKPGFFSDPEMKKIAKTYAGMLAAAMDNTYLFNELRQATLRDPLTGLHNRRFLEEYLVKQEAALAREDRSAAIIMVDIDHFKHFNDTYGHDAGDHALRAVGSVLQRHLRAGDVACRFGGEEMVVFVHDVDADEALQVAERLRKAIEAEAIRLPEHIDPLRLTVSAGVALYPLHAPTLLDAIKAADQALYEAKRHGRNRVVLFDRAVDAAASDTPQPDEKAA